MKSYVFPGNIEEEILAIGGKPFIYMRTPAFSEIVKGCERRLLNFIDCPEGRVMFFTSSGTGAMDSVVTNYVASKGKALVIAGGSFGKRWKELCEYYGVESEKYEVPFTKDIDYCDFEKRVEAYRPAVLLCQHHETSSGQMFDLKKIGEICRKYDVSLVVDAISSFLTDHLSMAEYGIDICLTSSQKGLNIAPGIALVMLSKRVADFEFGHKSYYFDYKENLKNLERGQTPYSPATTLFLQLEARLKQLEEEGIENHIEVVAERAQYFRGLCDKYQWERPVETPSNCVTGFFVKNNGDILARELSKEDIYIMPGGTPNYFRVSHSGVQTHEEMDYLAKRINEIENLKS